MSVADDNHVGEPGYPAPWTTNRPLEGLRDVDDARIVSLSPDVCLTPVGSSVVPIPYPVVDYCGHDRNYTSSVRFTGYRAMVMRSCTTHVHGDAPGTKKGVKSGTVESICEPIGHASQVKAEGSHVIRHLDRFWMNNKNTQGEAIFVKNTKTFDPPKDSDPIRGSLRATNTAASRSGQTAAPPGAVLGFVAPAGGAALLGEGAAAGTATVGGGAATTAVGGTAATATGVGLGTVLLGIGVFAVGMLVPTNKRNFSDFVPQDDYEAKRIQEAQQRINALPFWDSGGTIIDETKAELRKRRQTLISPQAVPVPQSDTARIDTPQCHVLPPYFTVPANGTRIEMQRQLDLQQSVLNSKDPCSAAKDIANYPVAKPIGEAARPIERRRLISRNASIIRTLNPSISASKAMELAEQQAANKDAIHTLDMIAGGQPTVFSGLGGRSENRSIGSQWGRGGKVAELGTYAVDQCRNKCPRMQTLLRAI